jgi:hypothetical protein
MKTTPYGGKIKKREHAQQNKSNGLQMGMSKTVRMQVFWLRVSIGKFQNPATASVLASCTYAVTVHVQAQRAAVIDDHRLQMMVGI